MLEANTSQLPEGCLQCLDQWPWLQPLAGVSFAALYFETPTLAKCMASELATNSINLSERVLQASEKRRAEFIAGRLCACRALQQTLATADFEECALAIDDQHLPIWPDQTVGSITHSDGFAAAVSANSAQFLSIGIDAEREIPLARAQRLSSQLLRESEQAWLNRLPLSQQGHFVTLVFSLKESLFKALFPIVQKRFYFQDAELIEWDNERGEVAIQLTKTLSNQWLNGSVLRGQVIKINQHLLTLIAIGRQ